MVDKDKDKVMNQADGQDNQKCECEGNCCPPKKNIINPKIIFTIVLLAAIGLIVFKLVNKPAPSAVNESCCPPQISTGFDTTRTATCDTTKGSSCCPK